jgi:hypothetical protein
MTVLPFGLGQLDWDDWLRGLASAFISGGSGAFGAGVANIMNHPGTTIWNKEFWSTVGTTFVIAGLIPFFAVLHSKPLPDKKIVTSTVQTTKQGSAPPIVVTTVQEKQVVPIAPADPPKG